MTLPSSSMKHFLPINKVLAKLERIDCGDAPMPLILAIRIKASAGGSLRAPGQEELYSEILSLHKRTGGGGGNPFPLFLLCI